MIRQPQRARRTQRGDCASRRTRAPDALRGPAWRPRGKSLIGGSASRSRSARSAVALVYCRRGVLHAQIATAEVAEDAERQDRCVNGRVSTPIGTSVSLSRSPSCGSHAMFLSSPPSATLCGGVRSAAGIQVRVPSHSPRRSAVALVYCLRGVLHAQIATAEVAEDAEKDGASMAESRPLSARLRVRLGPQAADLTRTFLSWPPHRDALRWSRSAAGVRVVSPVILRGALRALR